MIPPQQYLQLSYLNNLAHPSTRLDWHPVNLQSNIQDTEYNSHVHCWLPQMFYAGVEHISLSLSLSFSHTQTFSSE